jgi:hypothetical protein
MIVGTTASKKIAIKLFLDLGRPIIVVMKTSSNEDFAFVTPMTMTNVLSSWQNLNVSNRSRALPTQRSAQQGTYNSKLVPTAITKFLVFARDQFA